MELKPILEDNGLFWVTKEEFFAYFPTVYLSAFNMTRLQSKDYVNDLEHDFEHLDRDTTVFLSSDQLHKVDVNTQSDPTSKYEITEQIFDGGLGYGKINEDLVKGKSIADGIETFKSNPEKYLAMHYQTSMVTDGWPEEMHQYKLILREGTTRLKVKDESTNGKRTILINILR